MAKTQTPRSAKIDMRAGFLVNSSRRRKKGAKSKGSSAPSCSRARSKDDHDAREAENAQRLDKLLPDVWEKILDELEENDLFPLALSCRYFRQKQKELVARTRESGPESGKPRPALKTNLNRKLEKRQPASAEYLRFCYKEKGSRHDGRKNAKWIMCLAAFHGHLPLLQELQAHMEDPYWVTVEAGESSSSQSLLLHLVWLLTSFSSSQRTEANWRP